MSPNFKCIFNITESEIWMEALNTICPPHTKFGLTHPWKQTTHHFLEISERDIIHCCVLLSLGTFLFLKAQIPLSSFPLMVKQELSFSIAFVSSAAQAEAQFFPLSPESSWAFRLMSINRSLYTLCCFVPLCFCTNCAICLEIFSLPMNHLHSL